MGKQLVYINTDIDKKVISMLEDDEDKEQFLNYRKEFYEASNFKKSFDYPIHVDIELNNTCNYQCSFCEFSKEKSERAISYLEKVSFEKERIFELLKELKEIGTKSIQFNLVNEPLLYPHLLDVIEFASKLKFPDIYFITNASLLTKDISNKLINSGLTKIMFSLDAATANTYKKIRQKDNFEKVKRNILEFLEIKKNLNKKFPITRVSFVMTVLNESEKNIFEEYWKDKVDFIAFQNLIKIEKTDKNNNIEDLKNYRCNMPNFRLAIRPNGNVSPCCVFLGEKIVLGNINDSTIYEIWNSQQGNDFRNMHKDYNWMNYSVCKECISNIEF